MAALLSRSLLAGLLILGLCAYVSPFECNTLKENIGLIPPKLPESFIWKAEVTNLMTKSTGWEEMYFDAGKERAKYKYVLDGIEKNYIFDYDVEQIVSYTRFYPGDYEGRDARSKMSCEAKDMDISGMKDLFGYRNGEFQKSSQMYSSNEVLRFDGPYSYAFVKRTDDLKDERGIAVNAFHSCLHDKALNVLVNATYFWTGDNAVPPSGDVDEDVDENGNKRPLSRPVKVVYFGSKYPDTSGGNIVLNSSHSIVMFAGNPTFSDSDFQIPLRMYCENYRKRKDMPTLPTSFSTRMEKVTVGRDSDGKRVSSVEDYSEIWYDSNFGLLRRDSTLGVDDSYPDVRKAFPGAVFISTVYDFNTGMVYWIDRTTGRCFPKAIVQSDPMVKQQTVGLYIADPATILYINPKDVEYKGKYVVRDIKCDVWSRREKTPDGSTIYQEFYFPTDGFHSMADSDEEFAVPVRSAIFNSTKTKDSRQFSFVDRNFFKFKVVQPSVSVYDVSSCLEHFDHRYFRIALEGTTDTAMANKLKVLDAARMALTTYGDLGSNLRIQELQLTPVGEVTMMIKFAIMEKVTPVGEVPGPDSKGATLDEAAEKLKKATLEGGVTIEVVTDTLREPMVLTAIKFEEVNTGSGAQQYFSGRNDRDANPRDGGQHSGRRPDKVAAVGYETEVPSGTGVPEIDEKDSATGYSAGSLAALAICMLLIGAAIGVGIMVYYHRRYGLTSASNPHYKMDERT